MANRWHWSYKECLENRNNLVVFIDKFDPEEKINIPQISTS